MTEQRNSSIEHRIRQQRLVLDSQAKERTLQAAQISQYEKAQRSRAMQRKSVELQTKEMALAIKNQLKFVEHVRHSSDCPYPQNRLV